MGPARTPKRDGPRNRKFPPPGHPSEDAEDYENVAPPLPPPHLPLKTLGPPQPPPHLPHGGDAGPLPSPPPAAPPHETRDRGGPPGRGLLGLAVTLGVLATAGAVGIGLGTRSLDRALAEVQLQQQQLQQDLAALRQTLGGLCQRCPWGWAPFGGSCYLFAGGARRWREAEGSCAAQGGHLLILDTPEEQEFVLRAAPQPRGYWLGLSDREQEGGWRWLDGAPPVFSAWGRGEPNGGRGQNCAALLPHGRWDDLACERALPWVCERPPPC